MVLSKKKTITIALALADDRMLSRAAAIVGAANARGLSGENGGRPADGAHEVTTSSRLTGHLARLAHPAQYTQRGPRAKSPRTGRVCACVRALPPPPASGHPGPWPRVRGLAS